MSSNVFQCLPCKIWLVKHLIRCKKEKQVKDKEQKMATEVISIKDFIAEEVKNESRIASVFAQSKSKFVHRVFKWVLFILTVCFSFGKFLLLSSYFTKVCIIESIDSFRVLRMMEYFHYIIAVVLTVLFSVILQFVFSKILKW